jgi:hypothetical protein
MCLELLSLPHVKEKEKLGRCFWVKKIPVSAQHTSLQGCRRVERLICDVENGERGINMAISRPIRLGLAVPRNTIVSIQRPGRSGYSHRLHILGKEAEDSGRSFQEHSFQCVVSQPVASPVACPAEKKDIDSFKPATNVHFRFL